MIWLVLLLLAGTAHADSGMLLAGVGNRQMPLDAIPASTRAYSFRRLRTAYTANKAINIVRASDSATSDVGFKADGNFDAATAATFCSATTCKVVTKYDQSGNAADITQATDSSRPALVLSCLGATPCAQYTAIAQTLVAAGNVTPATGLISYSAVGQRTSGTGGCAFRPTNVTNNNSIGPAGAANLWRLFGGGTSFTATATGTAWFSGQGVTNGASSILSVNGTETAGTTTLNTTAGPPSFVGAGTTTCNFVEGTFWDNYTATVAERAYLTNNQRIFGGF